MPLYPYPKGKVKICRYLSMFYHSHNPYSVLSEAISFDNIQKMGELITLKTLCGCSSYSIRKLEWNVYTSIRRHLDYTSARLRRAVKVSSLLLDLFDR